MKKTSPTCFEQLEQKLPLTAALDSGFLIVGGEPDELVTFDIRRRLVDGNDSAGDTTLVAFQVEDTDGTLSFESEGEPYEIQALARARNRLLYDGDDTVSYRVKGESILGFGVIPDAGLGQVFNALRMGEAVDLGFSHQVPGNQVAEFTELRDGLWEMKWDVAGEPRVYELDFGTETIAMVSRVNSFDASSLPGPTVVAGEPIDLEYEVSNRGDVSLQNIQITDDGGTPNIPADDLVVQPTMQEGVVVGDVDKNGSLDPGETWRYAAQVNAVPGATTNNVEVRVLDAGQESTQVFQLNYVGQEPEPTPSFVVDLNGRDNPGVETSGVFVEGSDPVVLFPDLEVVLGTDTPILVSQAVVQIETKGDDPETLAVVTGATNVQAAYQPEAGTLELTGSDTLASYQSVLRTVTYANSSENPDTVDRSISVRVGDETNQASMSTLTIEGVNDTPQFVPIADQAVRVGELLEVALNGIDVDSESLTFFFDKDDTDLGLPENVSIVRTSGTSAILRWEPMPTDVGEYVIRLLATDDGDPPRADFEAFRVSVLEAVDAVFAGL